MEIEIDLTKLKWRDDGARIFVNATVGGKQYVDKIAECRDAYTAMEIVEAHNNTLERDEHGKRERVNQ